ncbi:glycosyltransferase family 4 protein [Aurantiacibacter hainanensis]|uniref:glycosyltransferase family 4 protein n=1 Tax=Aurantiacibacter hainanensis TaxID=3076114 RepID=UPI0030C6CCDF
MHIVIVSRGYPSTERLYNHGFVHRRALAYRALGHRVTVIWRHHRPPVDSYEYDGVRVQVLTPAKAADLIRHERPDTVALHAPGDDFAEVIEGVPPEIPVHGWIYGAEIMPFYEVTEREEHNRERWIKARDTFNRRIAYWQDLTTRWPGNFRLVFVSQFAADEAFRAVGRELPRWTVLPSPVDTELFRHQPKVESDRFEVLTVRPFSDWRYANDLSAKAIRLIASHELFDRFRFRFIGDGHLFEEMTGPIAHFPNVHLEKTFITQQRIAELHRTAGIFLCPTRNDAQGVARDEAMSSGLVPVTNSVGAVPEFADQTCAWLAPAEDHEDLARGLIAMAEDPQLFLSKSRAAAQRIRETLAMDIVVEKELRLMNEKGPDHP